MFFIFLVPSILLTINRFGLSEKTRELISFNLSGPLSLSICMIFFSQFKIEIEYMKKWVWPAVYPILGVLTLAVYSTLTSTYIDFGSESLFVTSGGYGPNQVSAVLGLGALLLIMLAISEGKKIGRFWAVLFALAFVTQSFLTFSRGGVYNFVIGLVGAIIHLLGRPDKFIKGTFVVLILVIIIGLIVIPKLDIITEGTLTQRFTDLDTTGREKLAKADLELFIQNPVLGVGPGMAGYSRLAYSHIASHTEYSRLIAEHGMGGLLALLLLLILLARSYFKAPDAMNRAWVVALAAWPLVEMAHAAMRLVSISFMLGIALVEWTVTSEINIEHEEPTASFHHDKVHQNFIKR